MTVIVFDADIYERLPADEFDSLLREKDDLIFAVTNPSFELFLLLHFEEAYIKWIKPNEREILTPSKTGQKSYICTLFSEISGMNPKKNPKVGLFADRVLSAIREEKLVNQNVSLTRGRITSTVGMVIDHIRSDNA